MITRHDCPCRYCTERYEACHDTCDRYNGWATVLRERHHEKVVESQVRVIMTQNIERNVRRNALQRKKGHRK